MATLVAIAAAAALFLITSSMLTGPDRIDVIVENPTAYELNVQVRGVDGSSGQGLGPIASGSTREFTGVLDQGETWLFEFSYGGVVAAEVTAERSAIEAGPVVVPSTADEVLERAGLSPPPG